MKLGVAIPYYKNSEESEMLFKKLMDQIEYQIVGSILLYIYEDGQVSDWLSLYRHKDNIFIESCILNKGVAYARNKCINYLKDKVDYILFIDSDDRLSDNYLSIMLDYCNSGYDIIESAFNYKGHIFEFKPLVKRGGMTGSAFKTSMIGSLQFDEHLQVGEDTKFMDDILDFSKHRKLYCKDAIYYYNYGYNPNSLIVRFKRNEISKERC